METPPKTVNIIEIANKVEDQEELPLFKGNRRELIKHILIKSGMSERDLMFETLCNSVSAILEKRPKKEYRKVIRYLYGERQEPR